MSEFSSDLNSEKLSEIQSAILRLETELDQIGDDVSEAKGDIGRLEVLEFFDRGEETRQVIVHWLEDVDGESITSLDDAKDAFVEFSELRGEDDKKHNVSHGDVLVIGGSCPWFGLCAKVDIKKDEDAGFQEADPFEPPVAGTEEENEEPYKEFIVWGGCGNEGGDPGGGGDGCVGTPSSVSISTALATTTGGVGPSIKLTEITPDPDAPDPPEEFTFNSGLSDFTIVEDPDSVVESGASFLAFDDSDINACWGDSGNELCGIKAGLVITELEKKLHKINAQPIEQKKVTIYPQELTTKNYTSQTGTITVGTASISSDECGNLSSNGGGGGGGGGTTFGLATLIEGVVETPKPADLLDIQDVPLDDIPKVSIGNLTIPTDFSKTSIEDSNDPIKAFINGKKAFIPMLESNSCPESATITTVTNLNLSVTKGECDSEGCQEITISIQPLTTDLTFKCGLLTSHGDETAGDNPPLVETFKVPCGCDPDPVCDPGGVQVVTLTYTLLDENTEVITMNWNGTQFVATGAGNNAVIDCNPATGIWTASGNAGSGNWSINGSANSPTAIPDGQHFQGVTYSFS